MTTRRSVATGCLEGEQAEGLLLGGSAQVVDAEVLCDHLLGELEVRLEQGLRRVLHG